jgi:hypothetical protein
MPKEISVIPIEVEESRGEAIEVISTQDDDSSFSFIIQESRRDSRLLSFSEAKAGDSCQNLSAFVQQAQPDVLRRFLLQFRVAIRGRARVAALRKANRQETKPLASIHNSKR